MCSLRYSLLTKDFTHLLHWKIPGLCTLVTCRFRLYAELNDFSQWLHLWFSGAMCDSMWRLRVNLHENFLLHWGHSSGISWEASCFSRRLDFLNICPHLKQRKSPWPCFLATWCDKFDLCANFAGHSLHLWGFSPVCDVRCPCRTCLLPNVLAQMLQEYTPFFMLLQYVFALAVL